MSDNIQFPFVIKIKDKEDNVVNQVREEDIAKLFFLSMADFDVKTLLRLRLVSKEWRDAIDSIHGTKLWGKQSLMRAVDDNRLNICQLILEHAKDKNPNSENSWGETPLHVAAKKGHLDFCRHIMDQVEEKNPKNDDGEPPLHRAARNGHLDICRLILNRINDNRK